MKHILKSCGFLILVVLGSREGYAYNSKHYPFPKDSIPGVLIELSDPNLSSSDIELLNDALEKEDYLKASLSENWTDAIQTAQSLDAKHGVKTYFFANYAIASFVKQVKSFVSKRISSVIATKYSNNTPYLMMTVSSDSKEGVKTDITLELKSKELQYIGFQYEIENLKSNLKDYVSYKYKISSSYAVTTSRADALLEIMLDDLDYEKSISNKHNTNDVVIFVNGFWGDGNRKNASWITNKIIAKQAGMVPYNLEPYWMADLDKETDAKVRSFINNDDAAAKQITHMKNIFIPKIMNYFKADRRFYLDGGDYGFSEGAATRREDGIKIAKLDETANSELTNIRIKEIKEQKYANLVQYLLGLGFVNEGSSIHIISHSMGGAFAEGLVDELSKSTKIKLGKVLHLSPANSKDIDNVVKKPSMNAPIERVQIISNSDNTIWDKDGIIHGSSKPLLEVIAGVDYFACFYEDDVVKNYSQGLEGWGILHATHSRSAVFEVINVLKKLEFKQIAPATIQCRVEGTPQQYYNINAPLFEIEDNTAFDSKIISFRKVCFGSNCFTINNSPCKMC
jgi:hypothetical protein